MDRGEKEVSEEKIQRCFLAVTSAEININIAFIL
jgi:hypothetical protein